MGAVRAALREWFETDGQESLRALAMATFALLAPLGKAHSTRAGRQR